MQVEIYALTCERYSFHPQAQPLFSGRRSSQFDLASCAEYTLPGKLAWDHRFQKARDGSVIAGVSCGGSHLAVACDLSTWDGTDHFCKCFVPDFGGGPVRIMKRQSKSAVAGSRLGSTFLYTGSRHSLVLPLFPAPVELSNFSVSETVDEVIVHHADRLHVRINDG